MLDKICRFCTKKFTTTDEDLEFLKRITPVINGIEVSIPSPTLCPSCRRQRRYSFRNDQKIYKRTCSKTGKSIFSIFNSEKTFPVYSQEAFWSDDHDPKDYGQDFSFDRPFFDQMAELQAKVPRVAAMVVNSENSDYTAFTLQSRNCYLSFRLADDEEIYYTYLALKSQFCFDCYNINGCELNYEGVDNRQCYHCLYTDRSRGSSDLYFCSDMSSCTNCFGSMGLVQKKYCFFNEQLTQEEYEKRIKEWMDGSYESVQKCLSAFNEFKKKIPVRALSIFNSENANGSYIFESKNIKESFDILNSEDVSYSTQCEFSKDVMDTEMAYYGERCYEGTSIGKSQSLYFSFVAINGNSDIYYSMESYNNCQNLFGCISMKKAKYCILNKQYTKEEYEALVPKIIEHMRKTGEWGEFFPPKLSPQGYNESTAQSLISLTKEEAISHGWNWYDEPEEKVIAAEGENIAICEITGKPFRIIPQEKKFYIQNGIPLPRRHPNQRHKDRLARRNPYQLRSDTCKKCNTTITTDQSSEKIIYCEKCYLEAVY